MAVSANDLMWRFNKMRASVQEKKNEFAELAM